MTRQLTDQLRDLIDVGKMAIGSMLPSERTLANSLGVARNVVRGSYEYLEKADSFSVREGRDAACARRLRKEKELPPKLPRKRRRSDSEKLGYSRHPFHL